MQNLFCIILSSKEVLVIKYTRCLHIFMFSLCNLQTALINLRKTRSMQLIFIVVYLKILIGDNSSNNFHFILDIENCLYAI